MKNIRPIFLKLWALWMWLCTFVMTGALIIVIGFSILDPYFFEIDSCMDGGGGWNHETHQCFHEKDAQECLSKGDIWNYEVNLCDSGSK